MERLLILWGKHRRGYGYAQFTFIIIEFVFFQDRSGMTMCKITNFAEEQDKILITFNKNKNKKVTEFTTPKTFL